MGIEKKKTNKIQSNKKGILFDYADYYWWSHVN